MTTTQTRTRKPSQIIAQRNSATPGPSAVSPIEKIRALSSYAKLKVIGRDEVIDAVLLGLVSGQNTLLLGVPGTAKTMLVQTISRAFGPGACFDTLLTKFTKADEVMGPVDLESLRKSEYRIKPDGYLPTARIGVLDEVFKGSSAINNAMLRLANERTYRNGTEVVKSNLRTMVGMSNEWPEDPVTLAAFFDRFPIKLMVDYLDAGDFASMMRNIADNGDDLPCPVTLDDDDLAEIDRRVRSVEITDEMIGVLTEIRDALKHKGVVVSDRRWGQSIRLMQAHAALAGRHKATRMDLSVLELVAWNEREQLPVIRAILPDYANPFERDLRATIDELYAARASVEAAANIDGSDATRTSPDMQSAMRAASRAISQVASVEGRLDMLREDIEDAEQQALLDRALKSVAVVRDAISAVTKGRDALAALRESASVDI